MIRRSVAGAILGLSLLVGSLAWWGFLSLRTVLDPDRSRTIAEELLDNDEVRKQLIENISSALTTAIPDDVPVSDEVVDAAAAQVLTDPAIEELILRSFVDTHAAFLGDGDAPESLDLTPVAESARTAVVEAAPQLDTVLPPAPVLSVSLPTERIPDASPVRSFLERVVPVLAAASLIGAGVALFTTTDRPGILRRAGTWALTTTAVYLAIGLGIPWLLRRVAPDGAEVFAALLTALLRATLLPSIVLGVVGAGLLVLSGVWAAGGGSGRGRDRPRRGRDQPVEEPPKAARRARAAGEAGPQKRPEPLPPRRGAPPPTRVQPSPYSDGPGRAQPSPYPDAPGRAQPSPYPDAPTRVQPSPYPDAPGRGHVDSVFDDIPPPSDLPPRPETAPASPGPAAAPASEHSVFADAPAASPTDPYAPRWVAGQGWVLHPDDPRPLPRNAIWVDGVGHVVPGPPP